MSAFDLKPWTKVVTPHEDILQGDFEMASYAANLGQVDIGAEKCPVVYRDPGAFFRATYLTEALRELLADILRVLGGGAGNRVVQLQTPFGGGKTHTLIALLHLVRSRAAVGLDDLPDPGPARVAVLPMLDLDATSGRAVGGGVVLRTLWGELAWRVGGPEAYAVVREADQARVNPGGDLLRRILEGSPTLILLDEVLTYVEAALALPVGDSNLGRQSLIFLQYLTEVVRGLPQGAMVYSLQRSVKEAVGDENLLQTLDALVSRIDKKREPVSGDDVLRVVQRRLFQELGDERVRAAVATEYGRLHERLLLRQATTQADRQRAAGEGEIMRQRVLEAYPLHPALLDLMYHRWGSLPSYQRTRGALQFLATVVGAAWRRGESAGPLLGPGDVLLDDPMVRSTFFSQVGEREAYKSVLDADLLGRTARCLRVDEALASDQPRLTALRPGTRLTRAIALYSHGSRTGEEKGVLRDDLLGAVQSPDLEADVLDAALEGLTEGLLYIHTSGRRFRFEKKPNLNKLLDDEARKPTPEEINGLVAAEFEKGLQARDGYVVWPLGSEGVTDRRPRFTVAFLGPGHELRTPDDQAALARQWTELCGSARRTYKNAVAFAFPALAPLDRARQAMRRAQAVDALVRDKKSHGLEADDLTDLNQRRVRAMGELTAALRQLYPVVYLPVAAPPEEQDPIRIQRVDIAQHNALGPDLLATLYTALQTWVFEKVTPKKLVSVAHLEGEHAFITGPRIVDGFFGSVQFPKLLTLSGLRASVARGVEEGAFGYAMGAQVASERLVLTPEHLSFLERVDTDDIDLTAGSFLVSATLAALTLRPAPRPTPAVVPVVAVVDVSEDSEVREERPVVPEPPRPPAPSVRQGLREVHLELQAGKAALFGAFQALSYLSEWADQGFTATVIIQAKGSKELARNTYETAVVMALEEEGATIKRS